MGSGFRTFQSGEVLTSSNVQNYLMDQAVMVFAGTAARGSAIASPETGMVSYRTDGTADAKREGFEFYDGSSWTRLIPSGAVVQVKQMQLTTEFITTSTTFTDITNLNLSITPTSASNNVLVIWSTQGLTQGSYETCFQLVRGSTAIQQQLANDTDGDTYNVTTTYLDSPATTSSTTYKLQTRRSAATGGGVVVNWNSNQQGRSSIILMEVTP